MSVKISYNDNVFKLQELPPTLSGLKSTIEKTYSQFVIGSNYNLHYFDEDGDRVVLSTQNDYEMLLSELKAVTRPYKIFVTQSNSSEVKKEDNTFETILSEKQKPVKEIVGQIEKKPEAKSIDQSEKKSFQEIEPRIKAFRLTKKLVNQEYKTQEEKAELESKLDELNQELSSEDKEWVASKLKKQQEKDQNRDWLRVAINVNKRFIMKGDDLHEDKKTHLQEKLNKALERLDKEQTEQLNKMIVLLKERAEAKRLEENNPKKLIQRFVGLWRRIYNQKANEKQKENFEKLGERLTSEQKKEADEKIEALKAKMEAKRAEKCSGDKLPKLLMNFREKYMALDESEKKAMNEKLDGTLEKIAEIFNKRVASREAKIAEKKKIKAEKKQQEVVNH